MCKKAVFLFVAILFFVGCGEGPGVENAPTSSPSTTTATTVEAGKIKIMTTLFPQYDFVRQLVGERAEVSMLIPFGVESHSYEPSPADIIRINDSQMFVYTGETMEAWAKRIIDGLDNKAITILDISQNVPLSKNSSGSDDHGDHIGHSADVDPHIWTSPVNAKIMVNNILEQLVKADEKNAEFYRENATKYLAELTALDADFRAVAASGKRKTVVFGGRNAFHYFFKEYGLTCESAYETCSSESEPSVRTVSRLIDAIRAENYPVIYFEELSEPKVAASISQETGVKMLLFHSCHNVSREDFAKGATYISLMRQNLANLEEGLI